VSVSALIVAALGALYSRANSPKASPGWYYLKRVASVLPVNTLKQLNVPDSTTNSSFPSSP